MQVGACCRCGAQLELSRLTLDAAGELVCRFGCGTQELSTAAELARGLAELADLSDMEQDDTTYFWERF